VFINKFLSQAYKWQVIDWKDCDRAWKKLKIVQKSVDCFWNSVCALLPRLRILPKIIHELIEMLVWLSFLAMILFRTLDDLPVVVHDHGRYWMIMTKVLHDLPWSMDDLTPKARCLTWVFIQFQLIYKKLFSTIIQCLPFCFPSGVSEPTSCASSFQVSAKPFATFIASNSIDNKWSNHDLQQIKYFMM